MALDFGTLLNAALGGTAAYQSGRRIRTDNEEKKAAQQAAAQRQAQLDAETKALHDAEIGNYHSLSQQRLDDAGWVPPTSGALSDTAGAVGAGTGIGVSVGAGAPNVPGHFDPSLSKAGREFNYQQTQQQAQKAKDQAEAKTLLTTLINPRTGKIFTESEANAYSALGMAGVKDAVTQNRDPNSPELLARHLSDAMRLKGMPTYGDLHEKDHFTSDGVDPETGAPVVINSRTGEVRLGGGVREGSGSGGSGGSGRSLLIETGLRAADHTFRSVEKPMSDYEAQVLKPGGSHMNAISKALGNVAIDPAHNPFLAPFAEAGLSLTDPKTLAYMRDAKAVVNAAMTTQPRGSDARAKSETVNSMLNAAPTPETIQAVRDWRHSYSVPTAEAVARLDAGRAPQGGVRSTPTSSQGSKVTINGKTFIIPP